MNRKVLILIGSFVFSFPVFAEPCTSRSGVGDKCQVLIEMLSPTQGAIGLVDALEKRKELQSLSEGQRKALLSKEIVPVVVAPNGKFYLLDGHHLAYALLQTDVKELNAEIEGNYSFVTTKRFWELMRLRGWVYPYDERGRGPLAPEALPSRIEDLKDDPYRSLAGQVRRRGGYKKPTVLYGEFYWANFFRPRIEMWDSLKEYDQAISKGLNLARTQEASKLPGWKGNR